MTTFISYSRADSAFVVRLAKDLKAAGLDVWVDQLDIPKGTRWDDEIEAAVEKSSTFMIVLAPESIESQNVKDELSYAIDAGKHILPVIIKPCKIPLRLRRFQHVDFTDKPYKDSLAEIKRLLSNTQQIPKGVGEPGKQPGVQKGVPAAFKTMPPTAIQSKAPTREKAGKSQTGKYYLAAGIIVVLGLAAAGILMTMKGPGIFSPPPATSTSTVTQEPPTLTQPATATLFVESTAPGNEQFYTEEFENDIFDWSQKMVKGVDQQVKTTTSNGNLTIDLSLYQDQEPYVLFINKDYTYQDVQLEATVTNTGINDNLAILACRIQDDNWYTFEISSGGTYAIKVFDTTGKYKEGFKQLKNGGSNSIKLGKDTNVYRAICQGSELALEVNGTTVATVDLTTFNLTPTEGYIGIGADSPNKQYPVSLEFESLKVSEP